MEIERRIISASQLIMIVFVCFFIFEKDLDLDLDLNLDRTQVAFRPFSAILSLILLQQQRY